MGVVIIVLSAILVGLIVFVALKYLGPNDDPATPAETVYETPSPNPSQDSPPAPIAGPFDGTWIGIVYGDYTPGYHATVDIADDGSTLTGSVHYTFAGDATHEEMDCLGTWTQTGRSANHVDVHEVITNTTRCTGEVEITLDLKPNGKIDFAIIYTGDSHEPKAVLNRTD